MNRWEWTPENLYARIVRAKEEYSRGRSLDAVQRKHGVASSAVLGDMQKQAPRTSDVKTPEKVNEENTVGEAECLVSAIEDIVKNFALPSEEDLYIQGLPSTSQRCPLTQRAATLCSWLPMQEKCYTPGCGLENENALKRKRQVDQEQGL